VSAHSTKWANHQASKLTEEESGSPRSIRGEATWECETDDAWTTYASDVAAQIETGYQTRMESHEYASTVCFQIGAHSYTMNFDRMTQRNTETGKERSVRRSEPRIVATTSNAVGWNTMDGAARPRRRSAEDIYRGTIIKRTLTPAHWVESSQNCKLVSCKKGSKEWNRIAGLFHETMPSATMTKVHRIQNNSLWRLYCSQKENMEVVSGKVPRENEVWHGTSETDPAAIYEDQQDGFMMQRSRDGMWGKGIYFAKKASYSDDYSHKTHGERQMLLVKLLVGDDVKLSSDNKIKHPPQKKDGSGLRYDTVTGHTSGSDVHVVYENKRAYPEYRVTYKHQRAGR